MCVVSESQKNCEITQLITILLTIKTPRLILLNNNKVAQNIRPMLFIELSNDTPELNIPANNLVNQFP